MTTRVQYLGIRDQLPAPTVAVSSGGAITAAKAGSYKVFLQGRNRAGYNLLSASTSFAVSLGQKVDITIPSAARRNGEDIRQFVVSVAPLASADSFALVAATRAGYDTNNVATTLPHTITLSRDEHLTLGATVATLPALPSGADLVPGMRRYINSVAEIREWDSVNATWVRVEPNSFSTYVLSSTGDNSGNGYGCNRDLRLIDSPELLLKEDYGADGSVGRSILFCVVNTGISPIAQGSNRVGVSVSVNDEDLSDLFRGNLQLIFRGYVDMATGILDTTNMPSVGDVVDYQGGKSGIVLEKPLPPGYGYVLEVVPVFSAATLNAFVAQGANVKVYPYFYPAAGMYSPVGMVTGDFIDDLGDRRRIVPWAGLSVKALSGRGTVSDYSFELVGEEIVSGFSAATANQRVQIHGNGGCFVGATSALTATRAIVDTLNGVGAPVDMGTLSLSSAVQVNFGVTFPTAVRGDYPDVIAGSSGGQCNISHFRVYVQDAAGGTHPISTWSTPVAPGTDPASITIGGSSGSIAGSLPSPAADFGCYAFTTAQVSVGTVAASSAFSTTPQTCRVYVAAEYQGRVTRISHKTSDGCIYELTAPLSTIFDRSEYWAEAALTAAAMRSIGSSSRKGGQRRWNIELDRAFTFVADSLAVDNGRSVLKPSDVDVLSPGRWLADTPTPERVSSKPTGTPNKVDELVVQYGTFPGNYTVLWQAIGGTSWTAIASTPIPSTSNPNGVVTPDFVGQECKNTATSTIWRSTGLTNADWVQEGGGGGGGGGFTASFTFESATTTAPSTGSIRFNHTNPASVTAIYAHETSNTNLNVGPLLTALLDQGSDLVVTKSDSSAYTLFSITGTVSDNGAYRSIPVTYTNAVGVITNTDTVSLSTLPQPSSNVTGQEEGVAVATGIEVINVVSPYLTADSPAAKTMRISFGSTERTQLYDDIRASVQNTVFSMFSGGTHSNISFTNSPTTVINASVSGSGGGTEVLTADRTYYVSTTGSNSNNGLSAGAPFLTIQKALDVVGGLDISIYAVTISVADGTYTQNLVLRDPRGSGTVTITGNLTTPTSVYIDGAIDCQNSRCYVIQGVRIKQGTTPSYNYFNVYVDAQSRLRLGKIVFDGAQNVILGVYNSSIVQFTDVFTVSSSAGDRGFIAQGCSTLDFKDSNTVTWQNTPNFPNGLLGGYGNSYVRWYMGSYSGTRGGGPSSVTGSGGIVEIIGTAP